MEHGSPSSARVSLVDGLFEVVGFVGGVLVAAGLVLILMAWNGTDERMPTQVPPRRLAPLPHRSRDPLVGSRSRGPRCSGRLKEARTGRRPGTADRVTARGYHIFGHCPHVPSGDAGAGGGASDDQHALEGCHGGMNVQRA
jgi:hypothetical protein